MGSSLPLMRSYAELSSGLPTQLTSEYFKLYIQALDSESDTMWNVVTWVSTLVDLSTRTWRTWQLGSPMVVFTGSLANGFHMILQILITATKDYWIVWKKWHARRFFFVSSWLAAAIFCKSVTIELPTLANNISNQLWNFRYFESCATTVQWELRHTASQLEGQIAWRITDRPQ